MSRLERSYRRLLRLYPRRYRAGREDEMLAVLLDDAAPGQQRASASDAADLVLGALRVRSADAAQAARARPTAAAGWGALIVGLVVAVLPSPGPVPTSPDTLPSRFAGYSYLTGSASASPPGPAVALYQQGFGVELFDTPQAVVVGASGAYRRLGRGGLLSPDGTRVASGGGGPEVAVQDLTTGDVRRLPVVAQHGVLPLAWSPDGRTLAVQVPSSPHTYYYSDALLHTPEEYTPPVEDLSGRLLLLDATTSEVRPLWPSPTSPRPSTAAFSADGAQLAVQDAYGELVLIDLADGSTRSLGRDAILAGPTAWSPDGFLLAAAGPLPFVGNSRQCDAFIAVDAGRVPPCIDAGEDGHHSFVGWTGPRSIAVLVSEHPDGEEADPQPLVEVDLDTGDRTVLSSIPTAGANYQVGGLQVAQAALTSGVVREPMGVERGRWPLLFRLVTAAGLAATVVAVVAVVRSGVRRRRADSP